MLLLLCVIFTLCITLCQRRNLTNISCSSCDADATIHVALSAVNVEAGERALSSPSKLTDPANYSPAKAINRALYSPAIFISASNADERKKTSHSCRSLAHEFVMEILYDKEHDVYENRYYESMDRTTFDAVLNFLTMKRFGSPARPAWEFFDLSKRCYPKPADFPDWSSDRYEFVNKPVRGKYKKDSDTGLPPAAASDRGPKGNALSAPEALMCLAGAVDRKLSGGSGEPLGGSSLSKTDGPVSVIFERFLSSDGKDRRALAVPNVVRSSNLHAVLTKAFQLDPSCGLFDKSSGQDDNAEFVCKCGSAEWRVKGSPIKEATIDEIIQSHAANASELKIEVCLRPPSTETFSAADIFG